MDPRHILITGAAGAIGGALAAAFRRRRPGARLTLVDRNAAGLRARAQEVGGDASAEPCDLTDIDGLPNWWADTTARRGDPDVLVNCAGTMEIISFPGTGWERGRKLIDINLTAPLRLMDLALPAMLREKRGWIVNVASMAGRVPIPGCSYYGGAKAGMGNASEIARLDLQPHGVDVVTVYPGPIFSGLESHARGQVRQGLVSRFLPTGKAEVLAERICGALERRDARVIYPDVYGAANHVANLTVTSWLLGRISPQPHE